MRIGLNQNNEFIEISDEARKANLAVFGIKNTGKAFTFIPSLFHQDLKVKNRGITIIVDTPELAWYLYGMCKIEGRKVDLLKPSINFNILNELLFKGEWIYEDIEKIYDYKKAVKDKRVTIIDMEEERYGEKAVRACSMLLLQLQSVMVFDRNKKADYSVYIDGASSYMPYINNLLKYGDYYGFNTTLFFKSRDELGERKCLIDNYVRNFILLQGISYEDAKYFGERLDIIGDAAETTKKLLNRNYGEIVYEILEDGTFKRAIGEGIISEFNEKQKKEFADKGTQLKKKFKETSTGDHHYQLSKAAAELGKEEDRTYLSDIESEFKEDDMPENLPKEDEITEEIEIDPIIEEFGDFQQEMPISETLTEEVEEEPIEVETPAQEIPVVEEIEVKEKPKEKEEISKKKEKIEFKPKDKEKNGEPQLNKIIKTTNVPKQEKRTDFSLLNEFDKSIKEEPIDDDITMDIPEDIDVEFSGDIDVLEGSDLDIDENFASEIELPEDIDLPDENMFIEDIGEPVEVDMKEFSLDEPIVEDKTAEENIKENEEFDLQPTEEDLLNQEFDLTDDTKFKIGGVNYPYRKIGDKKIEKSLNKFKI